MAKLIGIDIEIRPGSQYENGQNLGHWPILNFHGFARPSGKNVGNLLNFRIAGAVRYDTAPEAEEAARQYLEEKCDEIALDPLAQVFGN